MSTAVEMIEAHWPEHAEHTDKFGPPTMDQGAGVLCGCGEVLGWPVEEPPEEDEPEPTPLALDRPKSVRGREAFDKAAAAVAAARAKATPRKDDYAAESPKTGAYGTYERKEEPVTEPEIVDAEVVEDIPVRVHAGGTVDGQPAEEWRADQVAAGHGPAPEVLADLGVADEAQAMAPPTTEKELATNLGTAPDTGADPEKVWLGPCRAGDFEGYEDCFEDAVTVDPDRFCRTHAFVGTRQCDAMVPDGRESMDQCQGRTEFEAWDQTMCDQHVDYTGMGASNTEYVLGKVPGEWKLDNGERPDCQYFDRADDPYPGCVFKALHAVAYHLLSDGRKVHPDGRVEAAVPSTEESFLGGLPEDKEVGTAGMSFSAPAEGKELTVTGPEPGSGTPILPTDPDSLDPVMGLLPPLDPTQVYTPKDVEIGILEILRKLQNGELFLREQLARLHLAEHAHIMRYNLKIKTSNARAADQRKADAILACERERYEQAEAEMLVRAIRDTLHSLRSQLMGLQTVARSLGVSIGGPSYGP